MSNISQLGRFGYHFVAMLTLLLTCGVYLISKRSNESICSWGRIFGLCLYLCFVLGAKRRVHTWWGHGVHTRGSEATAALLGSGYSKDTCVRLLFSTNVISTSVNSQGTLRHHQDASIICFVTGHHNDNSSVGSEYNFEAIVAYFSSRKQPRISALVSYAYISVLVSTSVTRSLDPLGR